MIDKKTEAFFEIVRQEVKDKFEKDFYIKIPNEAYSLTEKIIADDEMPKKARVKLKRLLKQGYFGEKFDLKVSKKTAKKIEAYWDKRLKEAYAQNLITPPSEDDYNKFIGKFNEDTGNDDSRPERADVKAGD
jgi:hypothetical protein